MTDSECPFSKLLFVFQDDPDLLEPEEWEALQEHLVQDPPCALCYEEMRRNYHFLQAASAALIDKERNQ